MSTQQGVIEFDRRFEHIAPAIKFTHFLAFFQISPGDSGRIEGRNTSATGAAAFHQRALRHQFDLKFTGDDLVFGRRRHAGAHGEGRDQFLQLFVLSQDLSAQFARRTHRITHQGQILRALVTQRRDHAQRKPVAHAETTNGDNRSLLKVGNGVLR